MSYALTGSFFISGAKRLSWTHQGQWAGCHQSECCSFQGLRWPVTCYGIPWILGRVCQGSSSFRHKGGGSKGNIKGFFQNPRSHRHFCIDLNVGGFLLYDWPVLLTSFYRTAHQRWETEAASYHGTTGSTTSTPRRAKCIACMPRRSHFRTPSTRKLSITTPS